jgi:hypothetical protein
MLGGGTAAITTVNAWPTNSDPTLGTWLVTETLKVKLPAAVGTPLSTPAAESVRPGGSELPAAHV